MIDDKGWINNFNFIFENTGVSPFFNKRPKDIKISLIVIHCISLPEGEYCKFDYQNNLITQDCGIDRLFTNRLDPVLDKKYYNNIKDLKVSAHCVIFRNGSIKQYVSFLDRAWHAGESSFNGAANCNDYSIGIELEGSVNDKAGYTKNQYDVLNKLIKELKVYFKLSGKLDSFITTHENIAPGRKTDPGKYFDFNLIEII